MVGLTTFFVDVFGDDLSQAVFAVSLLLIEKQPHATHLRVLVVVSCAIFAYAAFIGTFIFIVLIRVVH